MEKQKTEESFISDIAAESEVGIPDPKEIRNWRIYIYCIGVCFGAVALGYVPSTLSYMIQDELSLKISKIRCLCNGRDADSSLV